MRLADVALLWGRAAGRCSAPDCGVELTLDLPIAGRLVVGERAHVISRSPRGPRGEGQRHGANTYDNLILLCPTHHRAVDKAPDDHPPELLHAWKADHEERVRAHGTTGPKVPIIWDVHHPLNRQLAGREGALHELHDRLSQQPIQVLHGLRGVGKSQLAVTYAPRYAEDYRLVYLVDASRGALERGLRSLCADVGLQLDDDSRAARRAVQAFLAERDDYLLILDRAPDASSVEGWLPERPAGHIIVTSTDPAWRRLGHPERVEPLDEDIGAAYLATRTGHADGVSLARQLGGLPLALEQAASYVETTGVDLGRYSQLFETAAVELLGSEPRPHDYDVTVLVTLSLTIAAIDVERQPRALTALRLLSYLDSSRLPRAALTEMMRWAPGADGESDDIENDLALGALAVQSVVMLDPESVSMHVLIGEVARRSQPEDPVWVRAVGQGLRAALSGDAQLASSFRTYAPLVEHVIVACGHARRLGAADEDTVHLLDRTATHLQQRGLHEQARQLFEEALALAGDVPPLMRCQVRMNHAALVDFIDPDEAVRLMGELLEELGSDPTDDVELDILRADLQQNLALALHRSGDSGPARELIGRARRIHDRVVPEKDRPESKNVIDTVNNDGLIAWAVGDYEHALKAWQEALALAEAAARPDPLLVARALANLGVLYENLERPGDSEDHHRRALELRRAHLAPDHPDVISSLMTLAGAHRARGKLGSFASFAEALRLDEEAEMLALGREDDLLVASALNGQALDRWLGGDVVAARPLAQRALDVRRRSLPDGHPQLLQARINVGRIALDAGDVDAATTCFEAALAEWRRSDLPPHHLQVALAHDGLGRVAAVRGDGHEACRKFRAALEVFTSLFGPDSNAVVRAREHVKAHCPTGDAN